MPQRPRATTPSRSDDKKAARDKWLPFYEELYKVYPVHKDFGGGFNALLELLEEGPIDGTFIMEKAESYARNVDPSNLEYVPHLKTWLRNRRFEDEDLFTDQAVAQREWLRGVWRRGDARAIYDKYGFIYNHPPIPEGVEDMQAWHLNQRKAWISLVAKHILDGEPYPE